MDLTLLESEERKLATGGALDKAQLISDWIISGLAGRDDAGLKSAPFVEDSGLIVLTLTFDGRRVDFRISSNGEVLSVIAINEDMRPAQMQLTWGVGSVCLLLDWLMRT